MTEPIRRTVLNDFDYCFAENGLTAYKDGKALSSQSFIGWLGEEKYKNFVRFVLHYIADLDIPIKRCVGSSVLGIVDERTHRGTFIEFRNGMVNVSPIGRNARCALGQFLRKASLKRRTATKSEKNSSSMTRRQACARLLSKSYRPNSPIMVSPFPLAA